jgi:ABC-type glycerol-3-phosphate transport system permease component
MIGQHGALVRAARVWVYLLLLAVAVPLLWVVRVAVKPPESFVGDPAGLGGGLTGQNFVDAWQVGGMRSGLLSSAYVVSLGAILSVVLATLAGYGLARFAFPGRRLVLTMVTVTMFLPLAALVIPVFELALELGILGHRAGLSLIYGTVFAAWATLFLRSYFVGLSEEVMEAAWMDGAGLWRTLWSVALPMARPAVATAFILNVFLQWSELLLGLILLPYPGTQTAAVAIAEYSTQYRTGGPLTAAGMVLAALPIVVLFVLGQRWLRAGALAGAVKE